jgi:hypothetical protein
LPRRRGSLGGRPTGDVAAEEEDPVVDEDTMEDVEDEEASS